jgi:hypothetical protein
VVRLDAQRFAPAVGKDIREGPPVTGKAVESGAVKLEVGDKIVGGKTGYRDVQVRFDIAVGEYVYAFSLGLALRILTIASPIISIFLSTARLVFRSFLKSLKFFVSGINALISKAACSMSFNHDLISSSIYKGLGFVYTLF